MQFLEKRGFKLGVIFIFIFGILLRLWFYFKNLSFWHDEAALALNIIYKSYPALFKGLDFLQVAPPFFLVISKFLYQIVHPNSYYIKDLLLRLIPLVSGIAAIPFFYLLLKKFADDKFSLLAGIFIFVFNTTTILYCAQFKQYSTELLVSIILMIIFYKILFEDKFKGYYALIIAVSPWFSLSSLFIIASYFFLVLYKKYRLVIKLYLPFMVSFILFYFFSLKHISSCNYEGMYNWWQNGYGFVSVLHPMRIVIRLGELFSFNKLIAECTGLLLLTIFVSSAFPLKKDKILQKLFIYLPILFTFLASALKLYPIEARLILFLYPLFVIAITRYSLKFKKTILFFVCIISFITSILSITNPARFLTSAREVVLYTESKIKPGELIILDNAFPKYLYYINNKNNIIFLNEDCGENFSGNCNKKLDALPCGYYYLIVKNNPKDKLTNKVSVLDEYNLYSSVIKFKR